MQELYFKILRSRKRERKVEMRWKYRRKKISDLYDFPKLPYIWIVTKLQYNTTHNADLVWPHFVIVFNNELKSIHILLHKFVLV